MPFTAKESDLGTAALDVINFKCSIAEGNPTTPSNNVVHANQDVYFCCSWTQTGTAPEKGWLSDKLHWHPRIYVEKMGPGEGPSVPWGQYQTIKQGKASTNYEDCIKLAANQLSEGVYRVVVTLNLYMHGHPSSAFHGFAEVGMIEVVNTP